MGTVLALIKKEFRQVFRDPTMLRLIFLAPILQVILLGYAVNFDVKEIRMAVYDFDRSQLSREFARSFTVGDYFIIEGTDIPLTAVDTGFKESLYSAALIIPDKFSKRIEDGSQTTVGLLVDGTNANSAGISLGYAGVIAQQFNERHMAIQRPITMRQKVLYNPELRSVNYMVPGVFGLIIMIITTVWTAQSIVRERELGTLEQLLVTPVRPLELLLGKSLPYAGTALVAATEIILLARLWFHVPIVGSLPLLFALALVFILTSLGLGLLISTISQTQQQALLTSFFIMMPAVLLSGFMFPIRNMPWIIQQVAWLIPYRYFLEIVRGIFLRGVGLEVLWPQALALTVFGVVLFTAGAVAFRKRL